MKYREILYGLLFGVGACAIDIVMHAEMSDRSLLEELLQPSLQMLIYRVVFLAFGVGLGMVLWQRNKHERETRRLAGMLQKLRHDIGAPVVLIYAKTQLLLTQHQAAMPKEVEPILQSIYEQSTKLQSLTRE